MTLPENCPRERLEKRLLTLLPLVRSQAIRSAFENRDVKLNGKRVSAGEMTCPGGVVQIYLPESSLMQLNIIFENGRIWAVHKPAGISCDTDAHGAPSLPLLLKDQLCCETLPLICHRLDNPTEGLVLLAKDEEAQQILQDAFRSRTIRKTYECLVKGTPSPLHGDFSAYLRKDARYACVKVLSKPAPDAKPIRTEYWTLSKGDVSRVRVLLHTGRTHQIRAHMSWLGYPILGDDQYGDREFNHRMKAHRLALCSVSIAFGDAGDALGLKGLEITTQPSF